MKGLFIPDITAEMFRNGCLESIETLMTEGEIYDIEYDLKSAQPLVRTEMYSADCINRKAVMDYVGAMNMCDDITNEAYENLMNYLEDMPSAHPERKKARWINKPHVYGVAYCSECDFELHINDTQYCPNCGCRMEGDDDETD